MDPSTKDRHWPWLGFALDEGLRLGLATASDVLVHATPEVLVAQLPRELTTRLLSGALEAGVLTPISVLQTAPPGVLAEHLEPEVVWHVLVDVAARARVSSEAGGAEDAGKRWLARVLERALDDGLISPSDVVRFVPPAEFVRDAPLAVVAEMIRSGLTRGAFNPDLVLVHLTPKVISENLKPVLAWRCLIDAVTRNFDIVAADAPASQPAAAAIAPAPTATAAAADPKREPAKPKVEPLKPAAKKEAAKIEAAKIEPVVARKQAAAKAPAPAEAAGWDASDLGDDVEVIDELPLPPVARQS